MLSQFHKFRSYRSRLSRAKNSERWHRPRPVNCGTALRRMLVTSLLVGAISVVLSGCGSGITTLTALPRGGIVTFVGDTPFCDVLAFRTFVNGLQLTRLDGHVVTVLGTSTDIRVDFAQLRDFTTVLNVGTIPEGTYNKATLTIAGAQLVTYDPTKNPPIQFPITSLSTSTPEASINPPLVITPGKEAGLQIDFDVRRSLQVDSQGQITGQVIPVVTFSTVTPNSSQGFGEMDDIIGFVSSVTANSPNSEFIGNFHQQLFSGTGPLISVNLTNSSLLCDGPPTTGSTALCSTLPLNQLTTGSFAEVDGYVDSAGNLVANTAEIEDREIIEQDKTALLGYVTSINRDTSGNLIQFQFYVREEEPSVPTSVAVDSIVQVNPSSSTVYDYSSRATNSAGLPFDPSALAVGQELVVHGTYSVPGSTGTAGTKPQVNFAADKIYDKLQTDDGNFSSIAAAGGDDKTGAFWMASCATLFQGAPILVVTNGNTTYLNLQGLSSLTPAPSLLVKGLLFYETQAQTITDNGVPVTVPAGTLVLLAKEVHQL